MKHTAKWLLAREIIILFCCALTVVLIWIFLWVINVININKSKNIQKQIYSINHQIDSISGQISIDSFEEIFEGKVPDKLMEEYKHKLPPKNYNDPLNLNQISFKINPFEMEALKDNANKIDGISVSSNLSEQTEQIGNFHLLYSLLKFSGFQFQNNNLESSLDYDTFKRIIRLEFEDNKSDVVDLSTKKPYLTRIYNFLFAKKYLDVTFYEFYMELSEKPHLPPWSEDIIKNLKLRDEVKKELANAKSSVYTKEKLKKVVEIIGIWILLIVYPVRFLILLLIWSIKTLRQNQS